MKGPTVGFHRHNIFIGKKSSIHSDIVEQKVVREPWLPDNTGGSIYYVAIISLKFFFFFGRDYFTKEGGRCTFDFFKYSDDNSSLCVAIRFDSKDVAKEVLNRYIHVYVVC